MSNIPQTTKSNPLLFLFGPTGVGKTELLRHVFPHRFSVVNADSKQVYRYLDIGSAKPDTTILSEIPHHLIDIRDPWEQFTVGDFVTLADEACAEIAAQGRIPLLCGGTAYYFKHFYFGMPASPQSDPVIRERVGTWAREKGLPWCFQRLQELDPVSATRIHPADGYRITRALEVYEATGQPLSNFPPPAKPRNGIQPLVLGLQRDKAELHERIDTRVTSMFKNGLVAEFDRLLALGATENWPGMQGIGYREFFIARNTVGMDLDAVADLIRRNSRLYAKRQLTFFKSIPGVHWFHPDDEQGIKDIVENYLTNPSGISPPEGAS